MRLKKGLYRNDIYKPRPCIFFIFLARRQPPAAFRRRKMKNMHGLSIKRALKWLIIFAVLTGLTFPAFAYDSLRQDAPANSIMQNSRSSAQQWVANYQERRETQKKIKAREKALKNEKKNPKNLMPQTYEEYFEKSSDLKNYDIKIPPPILNDDPNLTEVELPRLLIKKYNDPPGSVNLDLSWLKVMGIVNSIGVASPDYKKMAYSAVYFNSTNHEITSEVFYIPLDTDLTHTERMKRANRAHRMTTPLVKTGMDSLNFTLQRTLTIVDWSEDSNLLAVKETIGSKDDGRWQTNLWVYNFKTRKAENLTEMREAIKYWWKVNRNLQLEDYRWDIHPLGWDAEQPNNRIIVFALAYTDATPKFLGTWSIDYNARRAKPVSLTDKNCPIMSNGIVLREKY